VGASSTVANVVYANRDTPFVLVPRMEIIKNTNNLA